MDGNNNEPIPKKGRKFISSMSELKNSANYKSVDISKDTVMGILNRLIGDQRKLYQARKNKEYFFKDLEGAISFKDNPSCTNNEIIYIRNMTGNEDRESFVGSIKSQDPIFISDYSKEFWGVLNLSPEDLLQFILDEKYVVDNQQQFDPILVINSLKKIEKQKPLDNQGIINRVAERLSNKYEDVNLIDPKGKVKILPLYCSSLYLQLERLSRKYDVSSAKSPRGGISGVSKNGFTPKDFMKNYTSGKKLLYGNPYIHETLQKGEGKVRNTLKKVSGKLDIHIQIPQEKGEELIQMIENAGISSFYLGKKGLAYVSDIRV